jgi:hypothetical protein
MTKITKIICDGPGCNDELDKTEVIWIKQEGKDVEHFCDKCIKDKVKGAVK